MNDGVDSTIATAAAETPYDATQLMTDLITSGGRLTLNNQIHVSIVDMKENKNMKYYLKKPLSKIYHLTIFVGSVIHQFMTQKNPSTRSYIL